MSNEKNVRNSKGNSVIAVSLLIIITVLLALTGLEAQQVQAAPTDPPKGIERLAGKDRIDTALLVADKLKKELKVSQFDSVIVTRSSKFQDALSGSYLCSVENAPLILIDDKNSGKVINYIRENINPDGQIYILGGSQAVSDSIALRLDAIASTDRLSGQTALDTNLEILNAGFNYSPDSKEDILVCSGDSYADALSASATGKPILLVKKSLTSAQKRFLNTNKDRIKNIYIIGGTVAVSEGIEAALSEYKKPVRCWGKTRYNTSVKVAQKFYPNAVEAVVARGNNFPDGLAGGILAKVKGGPLLLQENSPSFITTYQYILRAPSLGKVTILGGADFISNDATSIKAKGDKITGLLTIGKDNYYTDINGNLARNESKTVNSKKYIFTDNGVAAKTGWYKYSGLNYYFSKGSIHKVCQQAKSVMDRRGITSLMGMYWYSNGLDFVSLAGTPGWGMNAAKTWGSLWFAGYGFEKGQGNCYVKSAVFYIMAKMRGYEAKAVVSNQTLHGWCLVKDKGTWYVWDVGQVAGPINPKTTTARYGYLYRGSYTEMPLEYKG